MSFLTISLAESCYYKKEFQSCSIKCRSCTKIRTTFIAKILIIRFILKFCIAPILSIILNKLFYFSKSNWKYYTTILSLNYFPLIHIKAKVVKMNFDINAIGYVRKTFLLSTIEFSSEDDYFRSRMMTMHGNYHEKNKRTSSLCVVVLL